MLSNGTVDAMTIIPPNGKMTNGNGVICINHNGNGKISNGKSRENGKSTIPLDEKSASFDTDFVDVEVTCGWGVFRPRWLQIFASKQVFLAIFCLTWVRNFLQKNTKIIKRWQKKNSLITYSNIQLF